MTAGPEDPAARGFIRDPRPGGTGLRSGSEAMPASPQLVAVAAHGLAGSRIDHPAVQLDDLGWYDLVGDCAAADLVGLLVAAAGSGQLAVTSGQAEELAVLEAEVVGLSRLIERRAATMASLLAAAGIEHRLIDGPARRLAYGDTDLRPFRSARLLVPPSRYQDAVALLGPAPTTATGRPVRRCERLAVVSTLPAVGTGPRDARIESRDRDRRARTRGSPRAGDESAADLVARLGPAATVDLAGRPSSALPLEAQLVVVCTESSSAPVPSLVQLRDVAQIALAADLDSALARRLAEMTGVTEQLAAAVTLTWDLFELADKTALSVWAQRLSGTRSDPSPAGGSPVRLSQTRRPSALAGGAGLAQRLLERLPVPAPGLTPVPTAPGATGARSTGSDRPSRSPRRSG